MQFTNILSCHVVPFKNVKRCLGAMPSPALLLEILYSNNQGDQCHDGSHFHSWWSTIMNVFPTATTFKSCHYTDLSGTYCTSSLHPHFQKRFYPHYDIKMISLLFQTPYHHRHVHWDYFTIITNSRHPSRSFQNNQITLTLNEFSFICPNILIVLNPHPIITLKISFSCHSPS